MKYRSQCPTNISRSNIGSYWLIILKYGVLISNSLQDIRQNHWTMKYTVTYIYFEVKRWVILTHNPEMMFIHETVFKITGPWNIGHSDLHLLWSHTDSYWLIIRKYDVHTSNSLQDIRQNHWIMKFGSCWPSLQCHKADWSPTNYLPKLLS